MITYKIKNIIDALKEDEIDVLLHGCNCFCGFGKGLAKSIEEAFPIAAAVDKQTVPESKEKLGTISVASVLHNKKIINCYTQFHWIKRLNNEFKITKNGKRVWMLANYEAIEKCFIAVSKLVDKKQRIGIPKIGAGDANGDWSIIEKIALDVFVKSGHTFNFYVLSETEIPK